MTFSDWYYLLLFAAGIGVLIFISELLRKTTSWSIEGTRKIVHIAVGLFVASTPFLLNSMYPVLMLGIMFAVLDFIAVRRHWLNGMHSTRRPSYGTVFYPLSIVILTLWLWNSHPLIFINSILIMAVPDALAAMVGEHIARPREYYFGPEKKSVQGSFTMFLSTWVILLIGFFFLSPLFGQHWSTQQILWTAIITAFLATAGEMVSVRGSDNLTVPLISAFSLFYLIAEPLDQRIQFSIGMALALILALISFQLKFLTGGGSVSLLILGTLVFGIGGSTFAIPILAFFVLSSILSKTGKKRKDTLINIFEKSGCRDAGQVLANGGLAGLLVLVWYFTGEQDIYILYITSLAAVTADTWATEIGVLSKRLPRSILTFKQVPLGTSGGITFLGSLGALIGSALIGFIGFLVTSELEFGLSALILVSFAGLIASFVDSLLGITVQSQYQCQVCAKITEKKQHCEVPSVFFKGWHWVNNDTVNLLCAVSGVLLVWIFVTMI
ncbi:MAG: DUF92 domain-containing protein [candidate division KSB1 bacterium]|nr:DUF92 domain-containing protein [candidate division KSB1 bacterium]